MTIKDLAEILIWALLAALAWYGLYRFVRAPKNTEDHD